MFDCAGYVFGSGLVVRIEKKKGGGGKNRAAFAMLNSASGGEAGLKESLTVCHLKGRTRPVSSALSPLSRRSASPRGDFRPPVSHSG